MKANNISNRRNGLLISTLALVAVLVLTVPSGVGAVEMVPKLSWDNTLEAQGSFAYARRGEFRELYGNGVTFALRFEHRLGQRTGIGVHVARVQMCKADGDDAVKLKYRDFAVTPMMTYSLVQSERFRLFGGGGAGLSLRKVILETYTLNEWGDPAYTVEFNQMENTLHSLLMAAADLRLGGVFFGARITYDRHFFGDAELGDFGDTGGFNFGGSFGFGF